MGLGKTVQIAGFLSAVMGKAATSDDKMRSFPLPEKDCRQALVVVPKSTLSNWQRELQTWGWFKVQVFHGGAKAQDAALRSARERECEVMLTTYDLVRSKNNDICAVDWEVTIWDEVHQIKNPKSATNKACMRVPCKCRYGLTGTPMSNEYKELWALFHFASDGRVGELKDFTSRYSKALGEGLKKSAKQWELRNRLMRQLELKGLMDQWMLQRFKSIIADQMPTKHDNIVFCRLAPEQEEVYMRVLDSPDYQQLLHKDDPCISCGSGMPTCKCHSLDMDGVLAKWKHPDGEACPACPSCILMPALIQLNKIANHLELLKPEKGASDEFYQKQADFARMAHGDPSMSVARDRNFWNQSHSATCGKMQALEKLLSSWKAKGSKVLLFSYSTQMLDILEDFVSRKGYTSLRLDGSTSTKNRGERVNRFNTSKSIFIFLLSTKAGGLGLNLVSANRVVIFDPNWNPAWDMQAQDRAYRIGQRQNVEVYRLISSNTIEEKVYQRQLYKQGQEGLVLHQRDETRYFEGVMGDRRQQGDLFGIKNLLLFERGESSQTLQKSGTRSIISDGRTAFEHESDEEGDDVDGGSNFVIRRTARPRAGEADDDADEADLDVKDLGAEAGVEWLLKKCEPKTSTSKRTREDEEVEGDTGEGESEEPMADVLRRSGAVHTHLNSKVLGGAAIDTLRKPGGASERGDEPAAPKLESGSGSKPPAPAATGGRKAPKHVEGHLPTCVADCIGDCRTYEDYIRRLHRDVAFASRTEYCCRVLGLGEELCAAVKEME